MEDRLYLILIDEFGVPLIWANGSWDKTDLLIGHPVTTNPMYLIRASHWPMGLYLQILQSNKLFRTHPEGMTETWDNARKEWVMVGFDKGPAEYWWQSPKGKVPIYDDFACGDDDEDVVGAG